MDGEAFESEPSGANISEESQEDFDTSERVEDIDKAHEMADVKNSLLESMGREDSLKDEQKEIIEDLVEGVAAKYETKEQIDEVFKESQDQEAVKYMGKEEMPTAEDLKGTQARERTNYLVKMDKRFAANKMAEARRDINEVFEEVKDSASVKYMEEENLPTQKELRNKE